MGGINDQGEIVLTPADLPVVMDAFRAWLATRPVVTLASSESQGRRPTDGGPKTGGNIRNRRATVARRSEAASKTAVKA